MLFRSVWSSDVCSSDLEDVTGVLADSVNTMAEQFGGIVRQVKDASNAVDRTAANVSKLTSDLAVRSLEQNKQVNNAIAAIHTIAESIRQVSRNAALSAEVSQTSRANARAGAEAVEQTHHVCRRSGPGRARAGSGRWGRRRPRPSHCSCSRR